MKKMIKVVVMIVIGTISIQCGAGKQVNDNDQNKKSREQYEEVVDKKAGKDAKQQAIKEREAKRDELRKKIKIPQGYDEEMYIDYLASFGIEWDDCKVDNPKVVRKFKEYYKGTPYRVIWNFDMDCDGKKEYLGVEVYPGVRRGIKRGILVEETGKVEIYIDTIKGVYTPEYMVLDLKRIGVKKEEIECYSIGYLLYDGEGKNPGISLIVGKTRKEIKQIEKEKGIQIISDITGFSLQRIDKDLKVAGNEYDDINMSVRVTDYIFIIYDSENDEVFYTPGLAGEKIDYKKKQNSLNLYRKLKKQGKVYGPPKDIDPEEARLALELLKT